MLIVVQKKVQTSNSFIYNKEFSVSLVLDWKNYFQSLNNPYSNDDVEPVEKSVSVVASADTIVNNDNDLFLYNFRIDSMFYIPYLTWLFHNP